MFGDLQNNSKGLELKPLSELILIERGGSPRPIEKYITDSPDGVNWIKIGDATEGSIYITQTKERIIREGTKKSRYVQPGDFLLSNSMSFGRPYILTIDGYIHDGWLVLRDNDKLFNKLFLHTLLSSDYAMTSFESMAAGSVVKNLNKELVGKLRVPVPDMTLQTAFATFVEQSDKSKFIRFKSQFIEMFGDPFENPKGYKKVTIGDVCEFQGGSQPPRKEFVFKPQEGYVRLIQIRDYKTDDYITYASEKMCRKFCTADDIMIGRYGPPIFQILQGIEGAYNVALMKAIPHGVNKEFMRTYLKRDELLHHLEMFSTRTAGQAGIEMKELRGYPFLLPPEEEQLEYVKFVEQSDKSKYSRS